MSRTPHGPLHQILMIMLVYGALVIGAPGAALAQAPTEPTVSATGIAVIERVPSVLRMSLIISAEGADAEAALQALREKRQQAQAKLEEAGAAAESIVFGKPTLGDAASAAAQSDPNMRQMQMMQMMMARRGQQAAPGAVEPAPVTVSLALTAEWPLEASDAEELIVSGSSLQERFSAAFTETKELTPEEQELLEEMQQDVYSPYDQEQPEAGKPSFTYVYRVSAEERQQALSDAVAKARTAAERLAKAAGAELGPIRSLASHESASGTESDGYRQMAFVYAMTGRPGPGETPEQPEAMAMHPGPVSYTVAVNTTFALNP